MSGIKQTFRYRDPRETRLLNQASKDQYGRQTNHVLYGFPWKASGSNRNQIIIGRGAIYTQDGVKIFFDDDNAFTVPAIDPSQGLTGGIYTDFPYPKNIIIGIQHNFVASSTAQEAKLVMIEVRTSQKDQEPAYYLQEINTITLEPMNQELVDPDRKAYNGLYDSRPNSQPTTTQRIETQQLSNSIPNNVTPLLRIRIQKLYNGTVTVPPYLLTSSGQLEDGVEIIRYKNMWQQVNDLLGVNVFEPLISSDQNSLHDLDYPVDARATQEFVKNTGTTDPNDVGTPTQHPLFGSFASSTSDNFEAYRFSNFLMDGRSVLEGIKRLDAWMRLLVNRTGEQSMVDLADSLTELQNVVNQGKVSVGDDIDYGSNFMLKNGKIYHVDPGNGATYGDTHRRALHFLDSAINYICNRLGMTPIITRAELETPTLNTTELWDLTNPPGKDITANLSFHDAIQALRTNFASRGNDIITGVYVFSLTETDRDQSGGIPAGQKTIVDNDSIKITDDTNYIEISKGSIDSSGPRSDKIGTVEVATLDASSRYKVNILAPLTAQPANLHSGPTIEGIINAPQAMAAMGMGNIFSYNRNWNQAQLNQWANVINGSVSSGAEGLIAAPNTVFEPEVYNKVHTEPSGQMSYALVIDNVVPDGNTLNFSVHFYDGSFNSLGVSVILGAVPPSGLYKSEGTIAIPSGAKWFRLRLSNSGSLNPCGWYGVNFYRNRIDHHIVDNNPTTGGAAEILARKDYVDAETAARIAGDSAIVTHGFGVEYYENNATFTVPVGVTRLKVELWGGGGGGCEYFSAGYGGGAGAYVMLILNVSGITTLDVTIGPAGAGQGYLGTNGDTILKIGSGGAELARAGGGGHASDPARWSQGGVGTISGNAAILKSKSINGGGGGYTAQPAILALGGQSPLGGGPSYVGSLNPTGNSPGGGGSRNYGVGGSVSGGGGKGACQITY